MTDSGTLLNSSATVTLLVGTTALVVLDDVVGCPYKFVCNRSAPGLLGNDLSPNGGTLEVVGTPVASTGTLVVAADGSFVYTPPP